MFGALVALCSFICMPPPSLPPPRSCLSKGKNKINNKIQNGGNTSRLKTTNVAGPVKTVGRRGVSGPSKNRTWKKEGQRQKGNILACESAGEGNNVGSLLCDREASFGGDTF